MLLLSLPSLASSISEARSSPHVSAVYTRL
jgi:hypothetical protein